MHRVLRVSLATTNFSLKFNRRCGKKDTKRPFVTQNLSKSFIFDVNCVESAVIGLASTTADKYLIVLWY